MNDKKPVNNNIVNGIKHKIFDPSKKRESTKRKKIIIEEERTKNFLADWKIGIRVLDNGFYSGTKSFIILMNDSNYLVNPGEGTSRICKTQGFKIKKIETIIMTRGDWKAIGGMSSLTLEQAWTQRPVTLHSPLDWKLGQDHKLNRMFIDSKCRYLTQHKYHKKGIYEDKNIRMNLIEFNKKNPENNKKKNSYEITFKKSQPKLIYEKIQELGVKPDEWIRRLKEGKQVTLKDGRVLNPNDYLDYEKCVEQKILIVDLPDESYIEELDKVIDKNNEQIDLITHLSDSVILNHPKYLEWIKSFKTDCIHMLFDEMYPSLVGEPSYWLQAQLHLIDQKIYPLLHGQTEEHRLLREQNEEKLRNLQNETRVIQADANIHFQIRPDLAVNSDLVLQPDNKKYMNEIFDYYNSKKLKADGGPSNEIISQLKDLKQRIDLLITHLKNQNDQRLTDMNVFPKVLFLGTSSSVATNYRNVTSILVNLNRTSSILLDCGEGTSNQIFRMFGKQQTYEELIKIKALFLTHIHLDHHGGVYGFILDRIEAFKKLGLPYEKIRIMVPKYYIEQGLYCIDNLLKMQIFDYVTVLPNEIFMNRANIPRVYKKDIDIGQKYLADEFDVEEQRKASLELQQSLGCDSIETIAVHHIGFAYAILLNIEGDTNEESFKLIFSGDCRPNECIITKGKKCDLLIHEATFHNELKEDAIKKNHSTVDEAIEVSRRMMAKQTILTHFSARYGILGHVDDIKSNSTGISFDFMYLNKHNMKNINKIYGLLKTIFPSTLEEHEKRNDKLIIQRQKMDLLEDNG